MIYLVREKVVHILYYKDEGRYQCYKEDDDIYRWPYYNDDIKINTTEKISDNIYGVYCLFKDYHKLPTELGKLLIENYIECVG